MAAEDAESALDACGPNARAVARALHVAERDELRARPCGQTRLRALPDGFTKVLPL